MSEFSRKRLVAWGTMATLGLAACSSSTKATQTSNPAPGTGPVKISVKYYNNGTRVTSFDDDANGYADILSYCDGHDLVDHTRRLYDSGNDVTRTPNDPACTDGRLDKTDFIIKK